MRYLILAVMILVPVFCYSDIYVAIGKETGICQGTVDVQPDSIGDWAKIYTMKKADESYRGLKGYEVKFEKGKLRKATKEEIAEVESSQPKEEILSQVEIKKLKELIK